LYDRIRVAFDLIDELGPSRLLDIAGVQAVVAEKRDAVLARPLEVLESVAKSPITVGDSIRGVMARDLVAIDRVWMLRRLARARLRTLDRRGHTRRVAPRSEAEGGHHIHQSRICQNVSKLT
jgi:hypothetical protein